MQQVEMETIHLYVVREKEKRPYTFLPLLCAFVLLVGIAAFTLYMGEHPSYTHKTLRVPAILLPLKTFSTLLHVIPTGVKTYPAIKAKGILTLTNGSVIKEELPQGMIFTSKNGIEVMTDTSVFLPADNADGYGIATVSAHAMRSGKAGNISTYDIDTVENSSIYVRNLTPFTGGQDAYSVAFVTHQDQVRAIEKARQALFPSLLSGSLLYPCRETIAGKTLTWTCQFFTYIVPSHMKVTKVRISGKNVFVDVEFIAAYR